MERVARNLVKGTKRANIPATMRKNVAAKKIVQKRASGSLVVSRTSGGAGSETSVLKPSARSMASLDRFEAKYTLALSRLAKR
jgi:hypothetical protein